MSTEVRGVALRQMFDLLSGSGDQVREGAEFPKWVKWAVQGENLVSEDTRKRIQG